jgi:uncharacterized membrane protein YeaQ/YmgE (transglycosylase-associated protein family)
MLGILMIGIVVGLVARASHPAGRGVGIWPATALGGVGALAAFTGGCAMRLFNDGQMAGWLAAMLGSALLVGIWGMVGRRGR